MVGATDNHVTIAGNLFVLPKQHLKNITLAASYISRHESAGKNR